MSIYVPNTTIIETNHIGINQLTDFYANAKSLSTYSTTEYDISSLTNFDANLAAVFLALNYKLFNTHKVKSRFKIGQGQGIFFRNGLTSHLSGYGNNNQHIDERESTIPLRTYTTTSDEEFCNYIKYEFLKHRGLVNVPHQKRNTIKDHYLEIFNNVDLHAKTNAPVFTCGQYFPDKRLLKFTLVDLGNGFLKPINQKQPNIKDDKMAIVWATMDNNTTKSPIYGPGGTGLKDLKRYCFENDGSLHICSGSGYVTFIGGKAIEYQLSNPFPGSIINIIFRNI